MLGEKKFDFPKSINLVKRCVEIATQDKKTPLVIDYFAGSGTTAHALIEDNYNAKSHGRNAKFVVVEQGEYFETVTKPRIIKAAYSSEWKCGKATSVRKDFPFFAKVLKLESYEDTLNNIFFQKKNSNMDLLSSLSPEVNNDYLIRYMLDEEARNALFSIDRFKHPFNCEMDITTDSAGATECKKIDLVETFNFLVGLTIKSVESNSERGYVRIEGTLPTGERTLILWRDCDKIGYEKLNDFANRFDLYAKEQTFDVIYINGDHNLPTAFTVNDDDGEAVRSLKLR
jgi:DNA methylase.